jgi:hypothetical protein
VARLVDSRCVVRLRLHCNKRPWRDPGPVVIYLVPGVLRERERGY